MKTLTKITKYLFLSLMIILASNSVSMNYAQNTKSIKNNSMEDIIANYDRSLNSENHGVRISTVEYVGRFKISNFEDKLIEMLYNEPNFNDKQIIALSLFQLGSLKSITALIKSLPLSRDTEYNEFCKSILDEYLEHEKLRSKYFENLLVSLQETK